MWLRRLQSLAPPNRRSAVAVASAAVAMLLIASGIAFAAQASHSDTESIGPIHLKSNSAKDGSTVPNTSPTGSKSPKSTTSSDRTTSTTQPPTTIIGPNGETITVPTPTTVVAAPPSSSTTATVPSTNSTTPPVTDTPPTTAPADNSTTTTRPPNQDPQLNVSVEGGSNPEDPLVNLDIDAADQDGYITSIDVTWDAGEGPQNVATYDGNACDNPPPSSHSIVASNTYSLSGTHSISVTVTTVSCNGPTQQAVRSVSVTSGGTTDTTQVGGDSGSGSPDQGNSAGLAMQLQL